MEALSDPNLITAAKNGDREAMAELFTRHYSHSLKLATGILRHQHDAQDAVQSAYFQAYRSLHSFREEASFKTWITRIVVNCCLLQLREPHRRVPWTDLDDHPNMMASHAPTPEKSTFCSEIAKAFDGALAALPRNLHDAYTLFTISELSIQEVAASLGLTLAATKTRIFRARAGMKTTLAPMFRPPSAVRSPAQVER